MAIGEDWRPNPNLGQAGAAGFLGGGGFHTCQTVVGFIVCVLEKFSLCSPGWSDIYYLDQDSFEITDIGLLVSSVLALKVCALYSVQQTA